ncbi:hypothetical protein [Streptomyces sp. NPDC057877]|uniref:hypothetical protein n=1 Tax=Streptomyces sp. NPDC057877 TaxID=3346269 RepID=UPI0036A1CA4F
MHRTTTTAALLVTVAVSALSGCTTVPHPPAPGPPTMPSAPPAQRPDHRAEPQIVQAPAREALELIGPSHRPAPSTAAPRRPSATAPTPDGRPPRHAEPRHEPRADHPQRSADRPDRSQPSTHPAPHPPRPSHPVIPDVSSALRQNADVCALGRKYGGWRPDSPESVTCEQVHGRR